MCTWWLHLGQCFHQYDDKIVVVLSIVNFGSGYLLATVLTLEIGSARLLDHTDIDSIPSYV